MCYKRSYVKLTQSNLADAIRTHAIVHRIGEHWEKWYTLTTVSDDGGLVYMLYHGMPGMYCNALIDDLELEVFTYLD